MQDQVDALTVLGVRAAPQLDRGSRRARRVETPSWTASSTCSTWRRNGCGPNRPCGAGPGHGGAVRHRRGRLRGQGDTTSGPTTWPCPCCTSAGRGAADRGDRHRYRADPRGDRFPARARRGQPVRGELRPAHIEYRIEPKNEPKRQLTRLLRTEHPDEAGIVYCLSRASVEKTADSWSPRASSRCPITPGLTRGPGFEPGQACARTG